MSAFYLDILFYACMNKWYNKLYLNLKPKALSAIKLNHYNFSSQLKALFYSVHGRINTLAK